jgi:very-short-patch-repair endonuclease
MAGEGGARSATDEGDTMPQHKIPPQTRALAKTMRRQPTNAETALWRILRNRRLSTLKFRRQAPIPPYNADFVCFEHRLIVEADGSQHVENVRDEKRDAFLAGEGFVVLRFWNSDILSNPRMIEETILARCGLPW